MAKKLTVKEYAAHRGVTVPAVHKAIKTGRLDRSVGKNAKGVTVIDLALGDEEWGRNTDPTRVAPEKLAPLAPAPTSTSADVPTSEEPAPAAAARPRPAAAPPPPPALAPRPRGDQDDLKEAKVRETHYKAELKRLQYEQAAGQLVPIAAVQATVAAEYTTVRKRLLGLPSKLAQELALVDQVDQVREVLELAITEALNELTADADGGAFDSEAEESPDA